MFTTLKLIGVKDAMEYFFRELYSYSNFERYNDGPDFSCKSKNIDHSFTVIEATVKAESPLRLSHSDWDDKYCL